MSEPTATPSLNIIVLGDRMIGSKSAYSRIAYELCTRLPSLGHHLAHIPMANANNMGTLPLGDILVMESSREDTFCEDVAPNRYAEFHADMLITVKEPYVFQSLQNTALNWVPMAIIDHSPVTRAITSKLGTAFKVIAVSRHAQAELKRENIESVYIRHGVDTGTFKPLNKAECKKIWHLPEDDFTVGIVAMNRARKLIAHQLRGYKRFLELNPDVKSHLLLWTSVVPSRMTSEAMASGISDVGVSLLPEINELRIGDHVIITDWQEMGKLPGGGIPDSDPRGAGYDMVHLYGAMNVHMLCSGGEAVGMTYLEAGASGVRSIATNYAGAPEHIGPTGIAVDAKDYVILNTTGSRYYMADIDGMAEALTRMFNSDTQSPNMMARRFAERFDWKRVIAEDWQPFLSDCARELKPLVKKGGIEAW